MNKLKKFFYSLILILLFSFGFFKLYRPNNYLNNFISNLTYPVLFISSKLVSPIKLFYFNFFQNKNLSELLLDLKNRNENLLAENIQLKASNHFIYDVKELVDFAKKYDNKNYLVTQILARRFNTEHYFLVDAGLNSGIEVDMVVVYKNCLVGKVSQVYSHYSKVTLITDSKCKISAYCNEIQAIHEGIGDIHSTNLAFINHLQKVNLNDEVFSSGQGLVFPRGFALGFVKKIEAVEEFYLKIILQPYVDFDSIQYCLILNKY